MLRSIMKGTPSMVWFVNLVLGQLSSNPSRAFNLLLLRCSPFAHRHGGILTVLWILPKKTMYTCTRAAFVDGIKSRPARALDQN